MEIKILQVFYGKDGLPYKDQERKVHFPIIGSGFQGASQTTKIRFYFEHLGDSGTTWVATAKLPDGKLGSKILTINYDSTLAEYYALLEMSAFYFQYKGDVFITLQGYEGGIDYTYDSESELYTINGTPIIQSSGSIKLTVNYATQFVGSGQEENATIQSILALVGTKVTKTDLYNVVYGTNGVGNQTTIPYKVAAIENSIPIRNGDGEVLTSAPSSSFGAVNLSYLNNELSGYYNKTAVNTLLSDYYNKTAVNTLLNSKQDNLISGTNIKTINGQGVLGSGNIEIDGGGTEVIANPTLLGGETKLASIEIDGTKYDLDNGYEKLSNKVTTLSSYSTDTQYPSAKVVWDNLTNVRAVAEGKCKTFVLSYASTISIVKSMLTEEPSTTIALLYDGSDLFDNQTPTDISQAILNGDYDSVTVLNSSFNTQDDYINFSIGSGDTKYLLFNNMLISGYESPYGGDAWAIVKLQSNSYKFCKQGDIMLVMETNVPDRWVATGLRYNKLETSKIDLTNYVTLSGSEELTNKTIYDGLDFVAHNTDTINLNVDQNIFSMTDTSENKSIDFDFSYSNPKIGTSTGVLDLPRVDDLIPGTNNTYDLGSSTYKWRNIYIAGSLRDGNNANYGYTLPDSTSLSASSELLDSRSTQTITGTKTFEQTVTVQEEGYSNNVITIGDYSDSDLYSVKTPCVITSNIVNEYSANAPVSIDSPIEVRGNAIPQLNNTYDLGSSSYAWKDLYLSNSIFIKNTSATSYWNIVGDNGNNLVVKKSSNGTSWSNAFWFESSGTIHAGSFMPMSSSQYDIGSSSVKWQNLYLAGNLTNTGSRTIDGLCGKTGTPTIESNATTLPYDTISTLSLSASTTLNLETAPSGCTPEYRAVITNSDSSAITITLPSGVKCLTNDEDNVAISSNTFTLASGTTIELNLCNSCAVLVNFEVA